MTPKHVITINFIEIGKVEITCDKCGAALILPVPQTEIGAFLPPKHYECPGCKHVLWNGDNDTRLIRLVGLVRSIGYWQELKDTGFSLSFSLNSN